MKKVAILLLTLLPFVGFSQPNPSEPTTTKNGIAEHVPSNISVTTFHPTNELPIYSEDDLKLNNGAQEIEMPPLKAKKSSVRTIRIYENPKVYYEVEVDYLENRMMPTQQEEALIRQILESLYAFKYRPQ